MIDERVYIRFLNACDNEDYKTLKEFENMENFSYDRYFHYHKDACNSDRTDGRGTALHCMYIKKKKINISLYLIDKVSKDTLLCSNSINNTDNSILFHCINRKDFVIFDKIINRMTDDDFSIYETFFVDLTEEMTISLSKTSFYRVVAMKDELYGHVNKISISYIDCLNLYNEIPLLLQLIFSDTKDNRELIQELMRYVSYLPTHMIDHNKFRKRSMFSKKSIYDEFCLLKQLENFDDFINNNKEWLSKINQRIKEDIDLFYLN